MFLAEHFLPVSNQLGEGPLWHIEQEALYWVDIERKAFYRYLPGIDQLESYPVGQEIGCLAFRSRGGLIMALDSGIAFWDWDTKQPELITNPEEGRSGARFNDGRVDSQGRFWAGTLGEDDQSKLYRLDPDGSLKIMQGGVRISNGIGWSPDQQTMYYTDSPLRLIYAYDFDKSSGQIENRREFIEVPADQGVPDGLTVDEEGFIWSAHWDGWRISRYDPQGALERYISLPVQRPTSCAFGGKDLDLLFITSAWTGLTAAEREQQPLAGDLFVFESEVRGQAEGAFVG